MRRFLLISAGIVGTCVMCGALLFLCMLRKQNESRAFLRALAEIRVGTTTKSELTSKMARFRSNESVGASTCYREICYDGIGYGFDNSIFGKFFLFRQTVLAAGVFYDTNNIVQSASVTLDRSGVASATIEERSKTVADLSPQTKIRMDTAGRQVHLILTPGQPNEISRLSVSCFTSWFGCDTSAKLISGRN